MKPIRKALTLDQAVYCANDFYTNLNPLVKEFSTAGSVRRKKLKIATVELVCVPENIKALEEFYNKDYPGIKINKPNYKKFVYKKSGVVIDLYIVKAEQFGRVLALRTGPPTYSYHVLMKRETEMGWCETENGLRLIDQCEFNEEEGLWLIKPEHSSKPAKPSKFKIEKDYFKFLGIDWIDPTARVWLNANDNK